MKWIMQKRNRATMPDLVEALGRKTGYWMTRELQFHPGRKWRFDYALEDLQIALEAEGGVFNGRRHIRPKGVREDMEKYNEAQCLGWTVIRVPSSEVNTLATLRLLVRTIYNKREFMSQLPF